MPTRQGVQSHISQSPACRARLHQHAETLMNKSAGHAPSSDLPSFSVDFEAAQDDPMLGDGPPEPLPRAAGPSNDSAAAGTSRTGTSEGARPGRVTVEEVEDVDAGGIPKKPWVGEFPTAAAKTLRRARTFFEELLKKKKREDVSNYAPFSSCEDWELAKWLVKEGLSQEAIDRYLALPIVRPLS